MDKDKRVVVRRSPAEWRAIMTRFECSGQSQREFAWPRALRRAPFRGA